MSDHPHSTSAQNSTIDWQRIQQDPDFAALVRRKVKLIVPATVFFLTYYMTLPILVGFWPEVMKEPVFGKVNWAYLFALSQFVMTWVMCWLYVRAAKNWDRMNAALLAKYNR